MATVQLIALAAALIFASATTSLVSAAPVVTYVFGDSLTEVGNNNYLQYSLARSDYPWYGIDFSGGQATGRFTNGRTIGDIICIFFISLILFLYHSMNVLFLKLANLFSFIFWDFEAEKLGIQSPPPYLSLSKNDDALLKGVNFASGGAGILNDTGLYFVISFLLQNIMFFN